MEYYQGYLMPVQLDVELQHKRCKQAGKLKKHLKGQLDSLEGRLKAIEGKLSRNSQVRRQRQYSRGEEYSRSLKKTQYRVIENEYHDYNLKDQNLRLRQQNAMLNEYFEVFSKKYKEDKLELEALRQENARLKVLLEGDQTQSPMQREELYTKLNLNHTPTTASKHPHHSKYVYDVPPYEQEVSQKEEGFAMPRLNMIKTGGSGTHTKGTAQYQDSSSIDYAKTSRSVLKSVKSGMI